MDELAIRVHEISKKYKIGGQKATSFRDFFAQKANAFRKASRQAEQEFWALHDVSFDISKGDVLGIIGKNGAGKSTLLKIISNITKPTSGTVELYGRIASLLEVGTGFHPELTGRENVYLNGTILGMSRAEVNAKFDEIMAFSGVSKFIDTPVKRYSSGMTVRLAFAVAAHLEPEILIIDEVLAVGDVEFQKKCLGKMDEISKKEGRTILFVSHNLSIISSLCTKGVVLEEGALRFSGNVAQCLAYYQKGLSSSATSDLAWIEKRSGNGSFRFTHIFMEDEAGNPVTEVNSGQNAVFYVQLNCQEGVLVHDFQLDIGINDIAGAPLSWLSTYYAGNQIKVQPGMNRIRILVDTLPLTPGEYRITLYGKLNGDIGDWVIDCFHFSVGPGDFYHSGWYSKHVHGHLLLHHTISLVP